VVIAHWWHIMTHSAENKHFRCRKAAAETAYQNFWVQQLTWI
jgi:hypothetical protein